MSNNTALANVINRYRQGMLKVTAEYDAKAKSLEPYAGSKGAAEELDDARDARDAAIDSLQADMNRSMGAIINLMEKRLGNVTMAAPSEEQLRILALLQMRDHETTPLTREELDSASRAVSSSDECMRVLSGIATKHHMRIDPKYRSARGQAEDALRQLRDVHRGMLAWRGETADELRARRTTAHRQRVHGMFPNEETAESPSELAIAFADIDAGTGGTLTTLNAYVNGMTDESWQLLD